MFSAHQRPAAADFTRQPKPVSPAPVQPGAGAAGRLLGAGCVAKVSPFRLTGPFAKMLFATRHQNTAEHSRYMMAVEEWCHAEPGKQYQATDNSEPAYQMRRTALLASRIGQVG